VNPAEDVPTSVSVNAALDRRLADRRKAAVKWAGKVVERLEIRIITDDQMSPAMGCMRLPLCA
jgi:hypothetical protein